MRSHVNSVKVKLCPSDPVGAAQEFVLHLVTAVDKNNTSDVTQDS